MITILPAIVVCLFAFTGCTGPSATTASPTSSNGNADGSSAASSAPSFVMAPITGEKSASSIADHIQQYLDQPDIISAYEKPILERARDNGGITPKEYEEAWSHYKLCMANAGFPVKTIFRYPSGLYDQSTITYVNGDYTNAALSSAWESCYHDIDVINQVYGVQLGNPNFYANRYEAIVDCLHRNELVSKSYTAQQYIKEEAESFSKELPFDDAHPSIDFTDLKVQGCFAANMSYIH